MSVWPTGLRTPQSPAQRRLPRALLSLARVRRSRKEAPQGPAGWHRLGPSVLGTAGHSPGVLEHRCDPGRASRQSEAKPRDAGGQETRGQQGAGRVTGRAQRALPARHPALPPHSQPRA